MGGGGSKPAGPRLIEKPNPFQSLGSSSADGLESGKSQGCNGCSIRITPSVSVSSVNITRTFGSVSEEKCNNYYVFKKQVEEGKLSYLDFKRKLQGGELYLYSGNADSGFCRQVKLPQEDADKTMTLEQHNKVEGKLVTVRVQATMFGNDYSARTKVNITPSIPPSIDVNGQQVLVTKMTLYYPCPLRVEGIQYDAVFSLNDPSDSTAKTIVLVPVKADPKPGPDSLFLGRVAAYVPSISQENPITGEIPTTTVPTGNDWNLTRLIPIRENGEVESGFFTWTGSQTAQRYLKTNNSSVKEYDWRLVPGPNYVMMKNPIAISPADFTSLQTLPETPPKDAIHPVLTQPRVIYKPGIPPKSECKKKTKKEKFTLDENTQESCDPFKTFENMPEKGPTLATLVAWTLSFITLIVLGIGVYFGLELTKNPNIGNKLQNWGVAVRRWILDTASRGTQ